MSTNQQTSTSTATQRRTRPAALARRSATLAAIAIAVALAPAGALAAVNQTALRSALVLPSARQCIAGGRVGVEVRAVRHVRWLSAAVLVNGRRALVIGRKQIGKAVRVGHLPSGRFTLELIAYAGHGRTAQASRTYRACGTSGRPTTTPPTGTAPPTPPAPGSYSGSTSQAYGLSFYVSPNSKQLEEVDIPTTVIGCTPTKSFYDQLSIPAIAIAANGSFSAATTQEGVLYGTAARFTYTFSGQFQGSSVKGSFREDIAFDDGTSYSCTTNSQTWSTTRDNQGVQTAALAVAGSYSGSTSQAYGLSFYVSPDSKQLEEVDVPTTVIGCTPTKSFYDELSIPTVAIAADGSFSATTTQDGVLNGAAAHFTYTFSGHLHGLTAAGVPRIAGTLREDITFDDGTSYSCTTNNQTWSTTRDSQGTQTGLAPESGSYSGSTSQAYGLSFSISSDGSELQNVSIPTTVIGCAPTKSFYDNLAIPTIPIAADGSFSTTTTQDGVIGGNAAHFTYAFSGHLHGLSASGVPRIAGRFREDITFSNGASYSCTTNNQTWSVTRAS